MIIYAKNPGPVSGRKNLDSANKLKFTNLLGHNFFHILNTKLGLKYFVREGWGLMAEYLQSWYVGY